MRTRKIVVSCAMSGAVVALASAAWACTIGVSQYSFFAEPEIIDDAAVNAADGFFPITVAGYLQSANLVDPFDTDLTYNPTTGDNCGSQVIGSVTIVPDDGGSTHVVSGSGFIPDNQTPGNKAICAPAASPIYWKTHVVLM